MAVVKEFNIKNTHIKINDEFVRGEYAVLILKHIVTAVKPSFAGKKTEPPKLPIIPAQNDLN